jgi:hypothetical protein
MNLFADFPDMNAHDEEHGVYGTYWRPPGGDGPSGMPGRDSPRIDILQGADGTLYYRAWRPPEVETIAPLPSDGTQVLAFAKPGSPLEWYVDWPFPYERLGWRWMREVVLRRLQQLPRYVPHDLPGLRVQPNPLVLDESRKRSGVKRARVRVTVDGRSEQFWLQGSDPGPTGRTFARIERRIVAGNRRRVAVTLHPDTIDLGFEVRLKKFNRRLDPGSLKVSHYSSEVDVYDRQRPGEAIQEDVPITLNEPASVTDPATGRCYRLYQSGFDGPWRPGHPEFDERLGPSTARQELFLSILSVNYDPGRGLKYAGTLMIFAGLVVIYYMRAYFSKKRGGTK